MINSIQNIMNPNLPTILIAVDSSGSMTHVSSLVQQKINNIIRECSDTANILFTDFNERYKGIRYVNNNSVSIFARGSTALYSTIKGSIDELMDIRASGDRVMTIYITDGMDNASTHSKDQAADSIKISEEIMHWDVLYLGTDQDAYRVAKDLNVKVGKALSFANTSNGFATMMETITDTCKRWIRSAINSDTDFIPQDAINAQLALGARKSS